MQAVSLPLFVTYFFFVARGVDDMKLFYQWNGLMTVVTLSIVFSRLYLGAHHLQDVAAGIIAGLTLGAVYSYLSPTIDFYLEHGSANGT